ncbi:MAG TPA: TetR/AcrR family transcriptional regulator [Pseudonocardia sp.]|jgi:AcrR family transcriptional regulator
MDESEVVPIRRRELAEWRRGQIIDAAMAVFGRSGLAGSSMKQVAAEAEVTPGLIYHYFASKEDLALAVIAERGFLPELRRVLAESGHRPAREVLPLILAEFHELLARRAHLAAVFAPGPNSSPRIREGRKEILGEGFRLLRNYLDSRIDAGELRPHDTLATAQVLLASCALGRLTEAPSDPAVIVDLILNGIAARH